MFHLPHLNLHDMLILRRLGLFRRLLHHKSRGHVLGCILGFLIMVLGCFTAKFTFWMPHLLWDVIGYTIHAIGAIPIIKHFDPLWAIVTLETIKDEIDH